MKRKKVLSLLLTSMMLASSINVGAADINEATESKVLSLWQDPSSDENVDAKPMLRFWYPDAGAGLTQEEITELNEQGLTEHTEEYLQEVIDIIHEVYDAGYGGVEMTMLADSANYGTELVGKIGWGTKAWTRILCQALATGNSLGNADGTSFKVDVTLTAHWPLIIDTIDPNDDEQQQELHSVIQDLDIDNLEEEVTLTLPEQDITDGKSGIFLSADKLVGVAVAKKKTEEVEVQAMMMPGQEASEGETTTELKDFIDYESLTNIVYQEKDGYKAGVPEGAVVYQYSDGRYYDYALAGTGDELGDPLQDGEKVALYPSADYHTFEDEENGGYIYVVDKETGEAISSDSLTYERIDSSAQVGPQVSYSSEFKIYQDGEDISDSVNVYFDSGKATNMSGALINADGTSASIAVRANESKESFGIVTEAEATEENPATERQYMDDIQKIYSVSGADIQAAIDSMEPLEEGESYVLVPVYRRGSGQVSSGGGTITMDNRTYCISYYDSEGAKKVIDYWEENMLDEPVDVYDEDGNLMTVTLREMLAGNSAGSLFEDSLEMSTDGSVWSKNMLEEFTSYAGYDVSDHLAVIAGVDVYNDENGDADKILEDYNNVKEELFNEKHVKTISEWANEVGGGYRFQSGSDDARVSTYVDIIEADNGSLSSVLKANGTVNAKGDEENPYLSMEAITSTSIDPDYYSTMIELNMNFVRGINRIVIHGIPFVQSLNGHINAWPGWVFGETALGKGYGAWDSREAFYNEESDIATFTDYVTRIQGMLQETQEEVPVMIVGNASDAEFETLRDLGLHYNVTSEYGMMFDNMSPDGIENGALYPEGLNVQMVVLDNLGDSVDQYTFLERMIQYADAGVKVVIYGDTNINKLSGADYGDYDSMTDENQTDAYAASLFQTLLENENTITGITTPEELADIIQQNTVTTISYNTDGLEAVHLKETDVDYYFFYNYALEDGYSPIQYGGVGEGLDLTNVKGKDVTSTITLKTDGDFVYSMDAYTGEITKITDYTDNGDGTVTFEQDIAAWDTAVLAVTDQELDAVEKESKTVEHVLDLTDAEWNLSIESYGPATDFDEEADFNDTTISTMNFEGISLGLWKDLKDLVSAEDLNAIGITDEKLENSASRITGQGDKLLNGESLEVDGNAIQYVSGIGHYTTTFTCEEEIKDAVLTFKHEDSSVESDARVNGDMVTKVTITNENGTFIFTGINQVSDTVQLGDVLAQGENTIEVKLITTLRNREWIEGAATGPMFNKMQNYGLTGVTIEW